MLVRGVEKPLVDQMRQNVYYDVVAEEIHIIANTYPIWYPRHISCEELMYCIDEASGAIKTGEIKENFCTELNLMSVIKTMASLVYSC